MDEDDGDENVWNASAVILDIDSGVPEDISSFFWISFFFYWTATASLAGLLSFVMWMECDSAEFNASGIFKRC